MAFTLGQIGPGLHCTVDSHNAEEFPINYETHSFLHLKCLGSL